MKSFSHTLSATVKIIIVPALFRTMIAGYHGPRELQSNFYLQPEEFAFICVGKAHHANSQNRFIQLFLEKEAVCVDIWGL